MNNSLKMDPLQTWLAALLTLLCIAVAIGSAKAASTVSPQPPEPSSTSASVTVEGKDRMLCADQDGRIAIRIWERVKRECWRQP